MAAVAVTVGAGGLVGSAVAPAAFVITTGLFVADADGLVAGMLVATAGLVVGDAGGLVAGIIVAVAGGRTGGGSVGIGLVTRMTCGVGVFVGILTFLAGVPGGSRVIRTGGMSLTGTVGTGVDLLAGLVGGMRIGVGGTG